MKQVIPVGKEHSLGLTDCRIKIRALRTCVDAARDAREARRLNEQRARLLAQARSITLKLRRS